jgi:tetratricopeptide (TPR) repeat protein
MRDDDIFDPFGSSRQRKHTPEETSSSDDFLFDNEIEWVPESRGTKPKAASSTWLIGLFVLTLVLLAGFGIVFSLRNQEQRLAPREIENVEAKFAQAAAAFDGEPADLNDPRIAPLAALIEDLRVGLARGDAGLIGDALDVERLFREVERLGAFEIPASEFEDVCRIAKMAIAQALAGNELADFQRFEFSRVELNATGDEALLYVRQWDGNGTVIKMRYWTILSRGRWRIYDFEDLSMSTRVSDFMALTESHGPKDPASILRMQTDMQRIQAAMAAVVAGDADTAESELAIVSVESFPPQIQALAHLIRSSIAHQRSDYELALREVDSAESLHRDMVILKYQRSVVLNALGRYHEALPPAQEYLNMLGADPAVSLEVATALLGLNRTDEAVRVLRQGLDDDPGYVALLLLLAQSIPPEEAAEIGERFMRLPDPGMWLYHVASELWTQPEAAWAIAAAYLQSHPNDLDAIYHGANALLQLGRNEEALATLTPVVEKGTIQTAAKGALASDYEIGASDIRWQYLRAVVATGGWAEVYVSASDKAAAFGELASQMAYQEAPELRELIAIRSADHPEDPQIDKYRGVVAMWDEDWDSAIEFLSTAYDAERDELEQDSILWRRTHAMFHAGRSIEALQAATADNGIFEQLMWSALDSEPPQLELMDEMLASYAVEHEDDPNVKLWAVRSAYQRGNYDEVLNLWHEYANDFAAYGEYYALDADNLKFLSHIRLRQFDDARAMADQSFNELGDPLRKAVVSAAEGNLIQTHGWLGACITFGYDADAFYANEILAEQLLSEEFSPLRGMYPVPSTEGAVE